MLPGAEPARSRPLVARPSALHSVGIVCAPAAGRRTTWGRRTSSPTDSQLRPRHQTGERRSAAWARRWATGSGSQFPAPSGYTPAGRDPAQSSSGRGEYRPPPDYCRQSSRVLRSTCRPSRWLAAGPLSRCAAFRARRVRADGDGCSALRQPVAPTDGRSAAPRRTPEREPALRHPASSRPHAPTPAETRSRGAAGRTVGRQRRGQ